MQSCLKTAAKRRIMLSPFYMSNPYSRARGVGGQLTCRRLSGSAIAKQTGPGGSDFTRTKSEETNLSQGDIYYHNELGYRGVVLYDFVSESTFLEQNMKEPMVQREMEHMYLGVLLSDPLEATRSKVEKHLTTFMVDNDGQRTNYDSLGEAMPDLDQNIVKAPLPGLDIRGRHRPNPRAQPRICPRRSPCALPQPILR